MTVTRIQKARKEQLSIFYVPIILDKPNLEIALNKQIDGTIFNEKIKEGNLTIIVTKSAAISFSIKKDIIAYRVPLHILVKKRFVVGDVEAEGDITLDFQSEYKLNPDWTIAIKTQITDYNWINKPKASLMGFKIPITAVAERILKRSKISVTEAIDKQVSENLTLKEYALQTWELLQKPILVDKDYRIWLQLTPNDFSLSPLKMEDNTISTTILVQGSTEISLGKGTKFTKEKSLFPLQLQNHAEEDAFFLFLTAELPLKEIGQGVLKNFKGTAYNLGQGALSLEDIQLSKKEDLITIRILTKGVYEGWLVLNGLPYYNKEKKQIEFRDIEFGLDTKNLNLDSKKWLLNGLLVNKLEGNLIYSLEDELNNLQILIQQQLNNFQILEGIYLKGRAKEFTISKAYFKEDKLLMEIQLQGTTQILINSLP